MADYLVTHLTRYTYSEKVSHCHNIGYLMPQSDGRQSCSGTEITVHPHPQIFNERSDYFANRFCYFSVEDPHSELEVVSKTRVSTTTVAFTDWTQTPAWEGVAASLKNPATADLIVASEFTQPSPFIPLSAELGAYARHVFSPGRPILDACYALARQIHMDFQYDQKATNILTPLAEVLKSRKGVCQDFAHLCIAAMRSIGLAASYVSGYIETFPPEGKPKLRGSDASHAWFAVFVPGIAPDGRGAWFGFDPTNGKAISEEFIVTARGRDFGDVSPLKGILFGGGKHVLKVEVDVTRIG